MSGTPGKQTLVFGSLAAAAVIGSLWFAGVQRRSAKASDRERGLADGREAVARREKAERDRELLEARQDGVRARDTARVLAAAGLVGRPDLAAALLRDAEAPAQAVGWLSAAINALQQPMSLRVLEGHRDAIESIDVSRDGRFIASASFDHTARLWPSEGGPAIVLEHDDAVVSASFDRKARRLVTASRDGTAKVWELPGRDAATPERLPEPIVLEHGDAVSSAQFSRDSSKVVTAAGDGVVRVWSLDDPSEPLVLGSDVRGIARWAEFSPDGQWVVAAMSTGVALVWSLASPQAPAMRLLGHAGDVGDVRFSPLMNVIATASADGTGRLYRFDPNYRGSVEAHAILEHDGEVVRVLFSPDGLRLVTSSRDMTAKVWTLDERGELDRPPQVVAAERDTGVVWSSDFSPDGMALALALGDGTVQVNPLRGGPSLRLAGHTSAASRVRFAPDGRTLISGSHDGTVRVWKTDFHAAARALPSDGSRITALEQRGRLLVSAAHGGSVRVWAVGDAGTGPIAGEAPAEVGGHSGRTVVALDRTPRLLATADEASPRVRVWPITGTWILDRERPKATLETGGEGVRALALDGDGELLAALLLDGTLALWQLGERPSEMIRLRQTPQSTALAFSADGSVLASIVDPAKLAVWDRAALLAATPGEPPEPNISFAVQDAGVSSVNFSPDGRRVVTTGLDRTVEIWNLDAPSEPPVALEHGNSVHDAVFDPSGQRLLTACADSNAYLWNLAAPSQPTLLRGATGEVRDVAFGPDGKFVAAASQDGGVRVWSIEGGEPIEFVAGGSLDHVEFVDGGRRVAAAGDEPMVWVWYLGADLGVEQLVQDLRAVTQVCPSASERVRYVGESLKVATAKREACLLGSNRRD